MQRSEFENQDPAPEPNTWRQENNYINFRTPKFNNKTESLIGQLHGSLLGRPQASEGDIKDNLNKIRVNLEAYFSDYFSNSRHKLEKIKIQAVAIRVFSQFLQNLVYFICHNVRDKIYAESMLLSLLREKFFFYRYQFNEESHIVIWVDPQEICTVLNVICRNGYSAALKKLLPIAQEALGGIHSFDFQSFIIHRDKDGFSSLNSAAYWGHYNVVNELLLVAERAFGGIETPGFQAFITHSNTFRFSSLNSAVCKDDYAIVEALLATALDAFGWFTDEGFRNFLTQTNIFHFSPLHSAVFRNNLDIVNLLLQVGKLAFGDNSSRFLDFLNYRNGKGDNVFNIAAQNPDAFVVFNTLYAVETEIKSSLKEKEQDINSKRKRSEAVPESPHKKSGGSSFKRQKLSDLGIFAKPRPINTRRERDGNSSPAFT